MAAAVTTSFDQRGRTPLSCPSVRKILRKNSNWFILGHVSTLKGTERGTGGSVTEEVDGSRKVVLNNNIERNGKSV